MKKRDGWGFGPHFGPHFYFSFMGVDRVDLRDGVDWVRTFKRAKLLEHAGLHHPLKGVAAKWLARPP
ncbi:hypothetical protein BXY66_1189 [Shimia isoporae]|uniref:Uncharacterized protein n=1 Tax=Shimia isoporae TaxID=647720 RepID=A0A4R1NLZ4_9RHOB|nr:hypothetical protein BXY66_1189 [Shimia isoporae]